MNHCNGTCGRLLLQGAITLIPCQGPGIAWNSIYHSAGWRAAAPGTVRHSHTGRPMVYAILRVQTSCKPHLSCFWPPYACAGDEAPSAAMLATSAPRQARLLMAGFTGAFTACWQSTGCAMRLVNTGRCDTDSIVLRRDANVCPVDRIDSNKGVEAN